jgi:hypothetical protein
MKRTGFIVWTVLVAVFVVACESQERRAEIDTEAVQAAMNSFVQTKLTQQGGTYDAKGVKAEFDYLHSGVKEDNGLYVSCADFIVDEEGYDVDYYVLFENATYTVVKEVLHKRNGEVVDEILWQHNE